MNLVLDIGNTKIKGGFFKKRELLHTFSFSREDENVPDIMESNTSDAIIISQVAPLPEFLQKWLLDKKGDVISFTIKTPIPIKIDYDTPNTLGLDRIANAVGANSLYPFRNILIVDVGTCTKIDLILNGIYHGGSISPGLQMRINAMHTFTDRLPLIKPNKDFAIPGKSTESSLNTGAFKGLCLEIDGFIEEYKNRISPLDIILTGGDFFLFAGALKNSIFAHPFLTLLGLNEILLFQKH